MKQRDIVKTSSTRGKSYLKGALTGKLSPHLFWDVCIDEIDETKHQSFIIQRVLMYGLLSDWHLINRYYGLKEIARTATRIRDLDERSLSFISLLANIPEKEFLCSISKPSTQQPWSY